MMSEIYRDRTDGVAAKRQDLLRLRRDDLATMPHAVRRVVVARTARVAASWAVIAVGTTLVALALVPSASDWLSHMPGRPATLSTLLAVMWAAAFGAWWIARARAEHRFAVAMSRYVLPGADVVHDIQRLDHERPDDAARQMAHRLEVSSAALPVVAATLIVPATAVYFYLAATAGGLPLLSALEEHLARHAVPFAAIALAGIAGAIAMTQPALRRPGIVALAVPVAIGGGALGVVGAFELPAAIAWGAIALATIAGVVAGVAHRLRAERAAINADDPAAGVELFTLRSLARSVQSAVRRTRAVLHRHPEFIAIAIVVAVGIAAVVVMVAPHKAHPPTSQQFAVMPDLESAKSSEITTGYHVEAQDGALRIDAIFDGKAVDIPALGDIETVPQGWVARIHVTGDPDVQIAPLDQPTPHALPADFVIENCDGGDHPLGLHLTSHARSAVLHVEPTLALAHCM